MLKDGNLDGPRPPWDFLCGICVVVDLFYSLQVGSVQQQKKMPLFVLFLIMFLHFYENWQWKGITNVGLLTRKIIIGIQSHLQLQPSQNCLSRVLLKL